LRSFFETGGNMAGKKWNPPHFFKEGVRGIWFTGGAKSNKWNLLYPNSIKGFWIQTFGNTVNGGNHVEK